MNRGAIRCVLSEKNRLDKLIVLDGFNISSGKTREMVDLLSTLGVSSPVLLVTDLPQSDLILASRNIKRVTTLPAAQINVLDLLNHDRLVITVDAIRKAETLWSLDGVAGDATEADNVKEGIS
jgi:large subunit ribosomal protein L4